MADAVILSQGNEVTSGQTVDTNAHWLAGRLWDLGWEVRRIICVPDRLDDLCSVLDSAAELGQIVVSTGGLGPTRDDLTAEAMARVLGVPLVLSDLALEQVKARFEKMKRTMREANRKQAFFPEGAEVLENPWGTAPGFRVRHRGAIYSFMPGVPREMKPMFDTLVAPDLGVDDPPVTHILRTMGTAESHLEHLMRKMQHPGLEVGFRTSLPENQVKLRFAASVSAETRRSMVDKACEIIGDSVFGVDSGDLAAVVGERLVERGETLALAESCTAGRLAGWVASVPGASRYLIEGSVVYANETKVRTCGVDPADLQAHGAVSEPVARQLARGIRERAGTTWGIGITGVAGPGGGTKDKPVGTVHVAVDGPEVVHRLLHLPGDRERVQRLAMGAALFLLFRKLAVVP